MTISLICIREDAEIVCMLTIPQAWKMCPFRAEPPRIGHYREYPLPKSHIKYLKQIIIGSSTLLRTGTSEGMLKMIMVIQTRGSIR